MFIGALFKLTPQNLETTQIYISGRLDIQIGAFINRMLHNNGKPMNWRPVQCRRILQF